MRLCCAALYGRVSEYFPCRSWWWPVTQDDLEEPILQAPVQSLSEHWFSPRAVLCEATLPESKHLSWHGHQLQTAGSSAGSWDIDAAHCDSHRSPKAQAVAARQHNAMMTSSHDVQDAAQGIELRPAKTNVLLGQYYMERSGQFVSANPGSQSGSRLQDTKPTAYTLEDQGAA